jgi:hypothetical protein
MAKAQSREEEIGTANPGDPTVSVGLGSILAFCLLPIQRTLHFWQNYPHHS